MECNIFCRPKNDLLAGWEFSFLHGVDERVKESAFHCFSSLFRLLPLKDYETVSLSSLKSQPNNDDKFSFHFLLFSLDAFPYPSKACSSLLRWGIMLFCFELCVEIHFPFRMLKHTSIKALQLYICK